jgi:hypothetical protein
MEGMKQWAVWHWDEHRYPRDESDFVPNSSTGRLSDSLYRRRKPSSFKLTKSIKQDIISRLEHSCKLLELPETGQQLTDLFLAEDFIGAWITDHTERIKRNRG